MKLLKNARRVLGGALSLVMMLTLFMWNGLEAEARIVEQVAVSGVQKYDSGFLKSFQLDYYVGNPVSGAPSGTADSRIAVQTRQFTDSDYTDMGNYASTHNYTNWPDSPDGCGFVAWSSVGTFTRPASGHNHSITVTFEDNAVSLNATRTYYVYIWTNYNSETYPDAYVYEFTAGQGDFTGTTTQPNPNPGDGVASQPDNNNQNTSQNGHSHNYQWTVIKEATEKTDGCTALMCEGCGHIEAKQPISFFNNIIYNVREEIKNAPENGIVTIDNEFLRCFSDEMVEELLARPDVTVVVNFTDKDVNYSFTIPAGKAPTDGQEWYGYYYLGSVYGWTLVEDVI